MLYVLVLESTYGKEVFLFEGKSGANWSEDVRKSFRDALKNMLESGYSDEIDSLTILMNESFLKKLVSELEGKGYKLVYSTALGIGSAVGEEIPVDVLDDRLPRFNEKEARKVLGDELFEELKKHNEKVRERKLMEVFRSPPF